MKAVLNQLPGKTFMLYFLLSVATIGTSFRQVCVSADVPHISEGPVLMLRPRAWNMVENNLMVVISAHLHFQTKTMVCLLPKPLMASES